jgi:hypothetical protein
LKTYLFVRRSPTTILFIGAVSTPDLVTRALYSIISIPDLGTRAEYGIEEASGIMKWQTEESMVKLDLRTPKESLYGIWREPRRVQTALGDG